MPAKQKVKKTKPAGLSDETLRQLDAVTGATSSSSTTKTSSSSSTTTKKKGFPAGTQRKTRAETLIPVMGRNYTKSELVSKVLQTSGKCLISDSILKDNVKRILHTEECLHLLEDSPKQTYSVGKNTIPILKEHIEYQLTNLFYIANVIAVSKGKSTVSEAEILLADLILKGRLNIHGDKDKTQQALILSQSKSKKETISLGQDVNIDKITMILQEALSAKETKEGPQFKVSSLLGTSSDKLKKCISKAEEELSDILAVEPSKKRKHDETKEEEQEEQEEPIKETKKTTKVTKPTKKDAEEESKPKKKKTDEKVTKKK